VLAGNGRARTRSAGPGRFRPSARDTVIAIAITAIAVAAAYGEAHPSANYFTPPHHLPHTPDAALLLVAAAGAVLAWRHRCPRLVTCATTVLVVGYTLPGYENGAAVLLPAFALGTLAAVSPVRRSVAWAVAVTAVLLAATGVANPLGALGGGFFLIPANDAVALFAGIAVASRHAYIESVRAHAARRAAEESQRRVDEERLRIARELHDVVAHSMATITVQAAAATQLLRDRPDQAAQSLKAIRAASKDGLRELRAILDVLRTTADGTDEAAATQPAPGLARLDALVAGVSAAGLPVTVTVTGQPRDLPAVTDLSAFRIIQEALTNTLRHAGPATAAVTLDYRPAALHLEVRDTGRGLTDSAAEAAYTAFITSAGITSAGITSAGMTSAGSPGLAPGAVHADPGQPPGAGHGLRGMRERAGAAGGTLDIGPLPAGGFRVAADLPVAAHEPAPQASPGPQTLAVPQEQPGPQEQPVPQGQPGPQEQPGPERPGPEQPSPEAAAGAQSASPVPSERLAR
jgi:signal transduction histidine kinase